MANSFSFVGYLKPIKDSEKWKGFTVTNYDSGWMTEKLRFNVVAGSNRHLVEINAGRWQDENKNMIYGFTKGENGEKGEKIQIPWSKRNDPAMIDKMNGNLIYTVDLDTFSHRQELENNEDTEGLEVSKKKRHHFLAATEFCEYANRVVNSEKIKNVKFRVNGIVTYTYSAKTDRYYSVYEVTKIYRVDDDREFESTVNINLHYTEGAMDCSDYDETGKATVFGYTPFYDNNTKKSWFCPVTLAMRFGTDDKGKNQIKGWKKIFDKFEDDTVRRMLLECEQIDGAQRIDVTYDDLSDDTKEMIDFGIITLEDAIRDAGGSMFGDKIQEIRIRKPGRGFTSGSETTMYSVDDLKQKPFKADEAKDLFDEDDDL